MSSPDNRPLSSLLGEAFAQFSKLLQNEIDLARAELSQKFAKARGATTLIAGGLIVLIPAIVVLLFAMAAGLIEAGLSAALSYFIVGLVAAIVGGVLLKIGFDRLTANGMIMPTRTIDELKRDKNAVKELAR